MRVPVQQGFHLSNRLSAKYLLLLFALFGCAFSGCAPAKRPFLIVQLCLHNEQGLAEFIGVLQSIAESQHMRYIDTSERTKVELETLRKTTGIGQMISLGVIGDNGVGLGAGNFGLGDYQVAVGFAEGSNPLEEHRFAEAVVRTLSTRWHIEVVPDGRLAMPLTNCKPTD
jgi:hypothetical protein